MERVLICGSAQCLWEDIEKAEKLFMPTHVVCINHTALYYPYFFQYWISYHPDIFQGLRKYVKGNPKIYGPEKTREVDRVWKFKDFLCSDSSLYAVKIMLRCGARKIVLCGVPLDNSPKFYSPSEPCQHASDNIQDIWRKEIPEFKNHVRSMSGNTKNLFGEPTLEWLNEN